MTQSRELRSKVAKVRRETKLLYAYLEDWAYGRVPQSDGMGSYAADAPIGHEMFRNQFRVKATGQVVKFGDSVGDQAVCYCVDEGGVHIRAFRYDQLDDAGCEAMSGDSGTGETYLRRLSRIAEEHGR